jgi:hypothetical protein
MKFLYMKVASNWPGRPYQQKKFNHQISGGPPNVIFRVKHRSMYAIRIWWCNTYLGFQEVECSQQDVYRYEYGGGVLVKFVRILYIVLDDGSNVWALP